MSSSTFDLACKARGFKRTKTTYARCIGDGILQILFVGGRTYVSPFSPHYSNTARKSNYISIGLWSMYCDLPEFVFEPGIFAGYFSVENFRGRKFIDFMGIQEDHKFMLEQGLDILDSIQTQESLTQTVRALYTAEFGGVNSMALDLCAAHLKCGQNAEALERVGAYYASRWAMFHQSANTMPIEEYQTREAELREDTKKYADLWTMIATRNFDAIEEYLKNNFERNLGYAEKYGVPLNLSIPSGQ